MIFVLLSAKHVVEGRTLLSCNYCGKVFPSNLWKMTSHLRIHSGEKPFPCPLCEKRFNVKSGLKGHAYSVHGLVI